MKGLLSTTASRAWMGVVAIGVIVVAVVIAFGLIGRLTSGQEVLDAAKPITAEGAVKGEAGGARLLSRYAALADPLVTKGGAAREVPQLLELVARRTQGSQQRARDYLRERAPRTEALLRSLPFSSVERERTELTLFLATTLNTTAEDLQDLLARDFPNIFQMLAELSSVTSGWRNVPGIEGLTRFDGKRVKTLPEYSDYVDEDVVGTLADEADSVRSLAGLGGIGYIPYLLLIAGVFLIGFGLLHARWARHHPSGKIAWGAVAVIGIVLLVAVGALGYSRLDGADSTIEALEPAFDEQRVAGTRAGVDLVAQAASFGDPIVTARGGAAGEVPKLVAYIAEQTGVTRADVRGRLRRAAPKTSALLEAIPLSAVSEEVPRLLTALTRTLDISRAELKRTLRRQTPGIAQALLGVRPVTRGWNAIPDSEDLVRAQDGAPVRTLPAFAAYLETDLVPVLEDERAHFDDLAQPRPPLGILAGIVLGIGVVLAIYATGMMFLATSAPRRY